METNVTVGPS